MPLDWLTTKKRFRLFSTTDHDALSLADRLVYSYLAYRARVGLTTIVSKIADEVGLERGRTVPKALERLQGLGLVAKAPEGWTAVEPTGEAASLFYGLANGEHWSQRFGYLWYYPSATLPKTQNYLLWSIENLRGTYNQTALERLTGLTRKTVAKTLADLESTGKIVLENAIGNRFRARITPAPSDFFDNDKAPKLTDWSDLERKIANWLNDLEIPFSTVHDRDQFNGLVRDLSKVPDPGGFLWTSQQGHDRYLSSRGGQGPCHCGYRLRMDLDAYIKGIQ